MIEGNEVVSLRGADTTSVFVLVNADRTVKKGYGMYEISIDGELVYSKKATGAHIEFDHFRKLIRERIDD